MGAFLASLAAPFAAGIVQSFLGGAGVQGTGGSGGNLLSLFTQKFASVIGQAVNSPLTSMAVGAAPALFSTAGMSPQALSDPMTYLDSAMTRMGDAAEAVTRAYRDSDSGAIVRDHRGTSSQGPIVRDHRTNPRTPFEPRPVPYEPRPRTTSGSDAQALIELENEVKHAKEELLKDPKSTAKALAAQEASQSLQILFNTLSTLSAMFAKLQSSAVSKAGQIA
jgi:hypothetical protein